MTGRDTNAVNVYRATEEDDCDGAHRHIVQFYATDDELVTEVVQHLAHSLAAGGSAIAISTGKHLPLFKAGLEALGGIPDDRVTLLDADEVLDKLFVDGHIDEQFFWNVIGGMVAAASPPLHVYGELVAVLWKVGFVPAAIELERLWNALAEHQTFALLCGYPDETCLWDEQAGELGLICDLHTEIIGTTALHKESGQAGGQQVPLIQYEQQLPVTHSSVYWAREFVRHCVDIPSSTLDAAIMIVSELVTNAFEHAGGATVVHVAIRASSILVSVDDDEPAEPAPKQSDTRSFRGRGLVIVDGLSSRWGVSARAGGGKSVWAEIDTSDQLGRTASRKRPSSGSAAGR